MFSTTALGGSNSWLRLTVSSTRPRVIRCWTSARIRLSRPARLDEAFKARSRNR